MILVHVVFASLEKVLRGQKFELHIESTRLARPGIAALHKSHVRVILVRQRGVLIMHGKTDGSKCESEVRVKTERVGASVSVNMRGGKDESVVVVEAFRWI